MCLTIKHQSKHQKDNVETSMISASNTVVFFSQKSDTYFTDFMLMNCWIHGCTLIRFTESTKCSPIKCKQQQYNYASQ